VAIPPKKQTKGAALGFCRLVVARTQTPTKAIYR
jgi:hypothetical protein